jgi:hypothetical protein
MFNESGAAPSLGVDNVRRRKPSKRYATRTPQISLSCWNKAVRVGNTIVRATGANENRSSFGIQTDFTHSSCEQILLDAMETGDKCMNLD